MTYFIRSLTTNDLDDLISLIREPFSFPDGILPYFFPGTGQQESLLQDMNLPDVDNVNSNGLGISGPSSGTTPRADHLALSKSPHPELFPGQSSASPQNASELDSLSYNSARATQMSLERLSGSFSFYIGPTGTADIHLLSREEFDVNNIARQRVNGLRYRRLRHPQSYIHGENKQSDVMFGITDYTLIAKAEPKVDEATIASAWRDLWQMFDAQTAWRLIQLYARFVEPYFPILSAHQIPHKAEELGNMPLCLLAAICASALPFIVHDESLYPLLPCPPSSEKLYRISWLDTSQQFHSPNLSTLQACLLSLQRLPTNAYISDTAFSWTLVSSATAVAQTIGLHRDPSTWTSVPLWERRLRKRLWWALWTTEKWTCLARGMPTHIHPDDTDVSDLTAEDVSDSLSPVTFSASYLCELVKLTCLLGEIQQRYYTVRASSTTANNLQVSLDLARSFRSQLREWRDALPNHLQVPSGHLESNVDGFDDGVKVSLGHVLDGNGSIQLSYIVTQMTLFRALLRPLGREHEEASSQAVGFHDGAKAVVKGSLLCIKEFVEFFDRLTGEQWNAFLHSWSRPNFAIAGSFMVHLLHITSACESSRLNVNFQEENQELRTYIRRWRTVSRSSVNGAAGIKGLANLGLLRVEAMLGDMLSGQS